MLRHRRRLIVAGITTAMMVPALVAGTAAAAPQAPAPSSSPRLVAAAAPPGIPAAGQRFERQWNSAFVGNAGSGSVTEQPDGSLAMIATDGKIAESEDGFVYYYTKIDPQTENFTLTATFHVDDASTVDNQGGYGVIAVDTLVPSSRGSRYLNSAASAFARQTNPTTGAFHYGVPGGRFVSGYTEAPDVASTARSFRDSAAFDWGFRSDYRTEANANPPKILTGDEFTLTLRKSNTGFHAWMGEESDQQVIAYDPTMLLQQTGDSYYVGVFAGRKIAVTVTDMSFTTIDPAADDPAVERPWTTVEPTLKLDSAATSSSRAYSPGFTSNVRGTVTLLDATGSPASGALPVAPGTPTKVPLTLNDGLNNLTAVFTPLPDDQQNLPERTKLSSPDPVRLPISIEVRRYGAPGNALYVAPTVAADVAAGSVVGSAQGRGTKAAPLDLETAIAFAQPGQQIVLRGGTYRPDHSIQIPRGRDGTPGNDIWLMSAPKEHAVVDLAGSPDGGFVLRADRWHFYDIEIMNAQGRQKAFSLMGNDNIIERLLTHHNGNTGLQISGNDSEPFAMWPARNLVLSSESHHNADPEKNDADGFAAKLTVGDGNVFRFCLSHHNIDDGFDLYAKSTLGPHGPVTIEDSVAYRNGFLTDDPGEVSAQSGKGFKLGGESIAVNSLLRNSIAYANVTQGVSSNTSPDGAISSVTAYANAENNLVLSTVTSPTTSYAVAGFLSAGAPTVDEISLRGQADTITPDPSNYLSGRNAQGVVVSPDWFVSTDTSRVPTVAPDGSIDMHGLFQLTDRAPGTTGARFTANPAPTVVVVGPEPGAQPQGVYLTGLSARAQCVGGKVTLSVTAVNGTKAPVTVVAFTEAGLKLSAIQPGRDASMQFQSARTSLRAGTATLMALNWTGTVGMQPYAVPYAGVSCR